jgi:TolB-like protein/Tfp pilus assembly protein PilF
VLPLDSVSAVAGDEYFAEGMTEALITQLMRLETLRVCPRTSSSLFRAGAMPLREIARELKVGLVVEGSVLHADGRVRITVRLIRGADEKPLWSGVYERLLEDVLTLQAEVARDIAREFRVQLTGAEAAMLSNARSVDPAAYTDYLRGRYFLNQRTKESLGRAREAFEQAIARDATYAPAYAGLADAYAMLGSAGYDVMPPHEAMPRAREAATRALALDGSLAEARAALGLIKLVYDWDFPAAERDLRAAAAQEPGSSTPWRWLGELELAKARPEEAIPAFEKAVALDPLSAPGHLGLGWSCYFLRRHQQAANHFLRALELSPNLPMALYGLGLSYLHQRQELEGLRVFLRADLSTQGDAASVMLLTAASAFTGAAEAAATHRTRLEAMRSTRYVPAVYFAYVYAISNDLDRAFQWLERAFEERSSDLIFLRVQPALHSLRADQRFAALMRRMGI